MNVNQLARALDTAMMDDAVLYLELAQLRAFQTEISASVDALGETLEGQSRLLGAGGVTHFPIRAG